jgi:hypothetical protein
LGKPDAREPSLIDHHDSPPALGGQADLLVLLDGRVVGPVRRLHVVDGAFMTGRGLQNRARHAQVQAERPAVCFDPKELADAPDAIDLGPQEVLGHPVRGDAVVNDRIIDGLYHGKPLADERLAQDGAGGGHFRQFGHGWECILW